MSLSIAPLVTYMRVFLESEDNGLQWETRLDQLDKEQQELDEEQQELQGKARRLGKFSVSSVLRVSQFTIIVALNGLATLAIIYSLLASYKTVTLQGFVGLLFFSTDSVFSLIIVSGFFATTYGMILFQRKVARGGSVEKEYLERWDRIKKKAEYKQMVIQS